MTQNIGFIDPATWAALLQYPLGEPPEGVTANLDDPTFYGQSVIVVASICLFILVTVLAIRLYAKLWVLKKLTPDDYVYFVSWPAGVAFICLYLSMDAGGVYGYHAWDIRIGAMTKTIIIRSQVIQILAGPLCWLIRLSLFTLIYYVFAPLRWTKVLVWSGVIVSGLIYLIPTIVSPILCHPRGGHDQIAYIAGMASTQCADTRGLAEITSILLGVLNVIVDFYILALPIPAIRNLQVSNKRRTGIYLVFGVALIGCMISVVALVFRVKTYGNQDITYMIVPLFAVGIVETTVGLVIPNAASIATVWQYYRNGSSNPSAGSSYQNIRSDKSGSTAQARTMSDLPSGRKHRSHQSWDTISWDSEPQEMRTVITSNGREVV